MAINSAWHDANRLPRHPSVAERVNWHAQHMRYCGCRQAPTDITRELKRQAGISDDDAESTSE